MASNLFSRSLPFARADGLSWQRWLSFVPWLIVALPPLFVIGRAPADVIVILIALTFIARQLAQRETKPFREPWFATATLFWLYATAVALTAENVALSFETAAAFIRFPVFALALQYWVLRDPQVRRWCVGSLAAAVAFVALDTVLQGVSGQSVFGNPPFNEWRLTGPFQAPVPGAFLAKTFFVVWGAGTAFALAKGGRWSLALAVVPPIIVGATIALTGERAALLTFGLALGLVGLLVPALRKWALSAAVVLALIAGALASLHPRINEVVNYTLTMDVSNFWEQRYGVLFRTGFAVWWLDPVTGVGPRQFRVHCANPAFEEIDTLEWRCGNHPHNPLVELLAETGVIGLTLVIAFTGLGLIRAGPALKRGGPLAAATTIAMLGLLVFWWPVQSTMSFWPTWNAVLYWLLFGWMLTLAAIGSEPEVTDG
ncbi:MAG: O-antigen ligase family protein [Geminicoccaceae bacterium]